jgi:phage replication-related protein YjqB (UPF0714/DUF867 family)
MALTAAQSKNLSNKERSHLSKSIERARQFGKDLSNMFNLKKKSSTAKIDLAS